MVRVLAVADTDSYLKWSVATLATLPAGWSSRQVLLRNAVMPSPAQVAAAGRAGGEPATPVETLGLPALLALLAAGAAGRRAAGLHRARWWRG